MPSSIIPELWIAVVRAETAKIGIIFCASVVSVTSVNADIKYVIFIFFGRGSFELQPLFAEQPSY